MDGGPFAAAHAARSGLIGIISASPARCVGPDVLAAHFNCGNAIFSGAQNAGRGTIAEQGRGDDVRLGQFIETKSQRAEFDRDQQYDSPGPGLRQPRGGRESANATGATKAEDGDSLDVGPKSRAIGRRAP